MGQDVNGQVMVQEATKQNVNGQEVIDQNIMCQELMINK